MLVTISYTPAEALEAKSRRIVKRALWIVFPDTPLGAPNTMKDEASLEEVGRARKSPRKRPRSEKL